MYGLLEWNENRPKRVMIEETAIFRVPFLRVSVPRGGPEGLTRRRLAWALRRCRKLGVMRWVLPEELTGFEWCPADKAVAKELSELFGI